MKSYEKGRYRKIYRLSKEKLEDVIFTDDELINHLFDDEVDNAGDYIE